MKRESGQFKNYWDYVKHTQKYPVATYIYRKYWKHNMVRIRLVIKTNKLFNNDISSPNQLTQTD